MQRGQSLFKKRSFECWPAWWQLVEGLTYIHEQLSMYHGCLSCGTVLLRQDGKIKIGNLCTWSILRIKASLGRSQYRRVDLGTPRYLTRIPRASAPLWWNSWNQQLASSIPIQRHWLAPEKWSDGLGIKDFLAATQCDPPACRRQVHSQCYESYL